MQVHKYVCEAGASSGRCVLDVSTDPDDVPECVEAEKPTSTTAAGAGEGAAEGAGACGQGSQQGLCVLVDGQAPLRLVLHPEAANRNLAIVAPYLLRFFDLRKEFTRALRAFKDSELAADSVAKMLACTHTRVATFMPVITCTVLVMYEYYARFATRESHGTSGFLPPSLTD